MRFSHLSWLYPFFVRQSGMCQVVRHVINIVPGSRAGITLDGALQSVSQVFRWIAARNGAGRYSLHADGTAGRS